MPSAKPQSDGDANLVNQPAQSPHRATGDMLSPSAADPTAPGTPGMASEIPSEPATHRDKPDSQHPVSSEHFFPVVGDDRAMKLRPGPPVDAETKDERKDG
jgi:hypothetical protein